MSTPAPDFDYNDQASMLSLAREALEQWRAARSGTAAERRGAQRLAFAVGRLDQLGAFAQIDRGAYK